ncbi:MAG: lysophospholipid acyltransferase family protein [Verrucomicrobiae bacterium]|nr:lysophospholipid acyltransferase family protein [Verrucomicrobiae bacterium]
MATFRQRPLRSGVVVPHTVQWHGRLAARLLFWLVQGCGASLRLTVDDASGLLNVPAHERRPVIFCLWHNRLAVALPLRRALLELRGLARPMAAMVSASKDGGLLARVLELADIQPVRGSSSRRGPQAMLELKTWAERGYDLAITPDGPRGPCCVVQDGVVALGQITGLPIIPVNVLLAWKWRVNSWDRFQVPLPFSPCHVRLGEPLRVPEDASDQQREELRQLLEGRMRKLAPD